MPKVLLRSGVMEMNSLIMAWISKVFTMSLWTCMRVRCVSRFCFMVLRVHVFRRRRVEKDLSEDATDIGRLRHNFMRFSTSLNKSLVCGWSLVRHEPTSATVVHIESLVMSPNILSWATCCGAPEENVVETPARSPPLLPLPPNPITGQQTHHQLLHFPLSFLFWAPARRQRNQKSFFETCCCCKQTRNAPLTDSCHHSAPVRKR